MRLSGDSIGALPSATLWRRGSSHYRISTNERLYPTLRLRFEGRLGASKHAGGRGRPDRMAALGGPNRLLTGDLPIALGSPICANTSHSRAAWRTDQTTLSVPSHKLDSEGNNQTRGLRPTPRKGIFADVVEGAKANDDMLRQWRSRAPEVSKQECSVV
jgi:hypothetical protein